MKHQLNHEIQKRAYEIFLKNGSQAGNDLENWLQAEKEICGKLEAPKKKKSVTVKNK